MNEALWLYAFTRLDSIKGLLGFSLAVLTVMAAISGILIATAAHSDWGSDIRTNTVAKPIFKVSLRVLLIVAALQVLLPNKNDAIFIVAGTGVIEAAKSEHVQQVAGKAAAVVEKALDDYLGKKEK